uniref:Uncharacterized protein n=1 Tax=Schistocephalus solidus TaxID=70667 RepID=A0A0V0J6N0_SCHSO
MFAVVGLCKMFCFSNFLPHLLSSFSDDLRDLCFYEVSCKIYSFFFKLILVSLENCPESIYVCGIACPTGCAPRVLNALMLQNLPSLELIFHYLPSDSTPIQQCSYNAFFPSDRLRGLI